MKLVITICITLLSLSVHYAASRSLPSQSRRYQLDLDCSAMEDFQLPSQLLHTCHLSEPRLIHHTASGFAPYCRQSVRCRNSEPSKFTVNICPDFCVDPVLGSLLDQELYKQDPVFTTSLIRTNRGTETVEIKYPITCRCTRRDNIGESRS